VARRSLCGAFSAQMLEYSRVTARQFTHIWKERQRCPGVCSCSYHRNRAAIFLGVGVAACLQAAMFNSAAGLAVAMWWTARPCLPLTNALLASGSSDLFCRICPRLWWRSYFGRVRHLVAKPNCRDCGLRQESPQNGAGANSLNGLAVMVPLLPWHST